MKAYIITFWLGEGEVEQWSVVIANTEEDAKRLLAEKLRDDNADDMSDEYMGIPSWQVEEKPINTAAVLDIWHQY